MKILTLYFKNINSLEGESQVDFQQVPFSQTGVFAITGPNGSGKSSILDVITLGFYGETAVYLQETNNGCLALCCVDDGRRLQTRDCTDSAITTYALYVTQYGELVMDTVLDMMVTVAEGLMVNSFFNIQNIHTCIGQRHMFVMEENTVVVYGPKCLG